jgi:hypothetical protein
MAPSDRSSYTSSNASSRSTTYTGEEAYVKLPYYWTHERS